MSDLICALHQNPIYMDFGSGVRTVNILKIVRNLMRKEVTLYALGSSNTTTVVEGIKEILIAKPFPLRKLTGIYFCILPRLIKKQLEQSGLRTLRPTVTIFEQPFMGYATMKILGVPKSSLKLYDAHNVEVNYLKQYFRELPFKNNIMSRVRNMEKLIIDNSDIILVTSPDEANTLKMEYGIEDRKFIIAPNGTDTSIIFPLDEKKRTDLKQSQNWNYTRSVVFMGSKVKPNVEACKWLIKDLVNTMTNTTFLIIGSVCSTIRETPRNLKLLGLLPEATKNRILQLADVALNPVSEGAGTNVKMVEYLAAGLPVLTTPVGARGLGLIDQRESIIVPRKEFRAALENIFKNTSLLESLRINARLKSKEFDWSTIAATIRKQLKPYL